VVFERGAKIMNEAVVVEGRPLSQVERVVDTIVAPSKTFTDILRSTSWWLPFLLAVIVLMGSAFAMDQKIGFDHIAEQAVQENPAAAEKMSQLMPEQNAQQMRIMGISYKYSSYAAGAFVLIISAIGALVLWASFNFGLGARTTYAQMFAVWMYASLPRLFTGILNIIFVYAGVNTENFDLKNPVGTNIGYYMQNASPWFKTAMSFFDIFSLWTMVLMIIGCAIVARKSKGQSAVIIIGWWVIVLLVTVGITAATS
jgi:hypothetical protein